MDTPQMRHYRRNVQQYVDRSKRRQEEIRGLLLKIKSVPCADCGTLYPSYVMDFDHIHGEKKFILSVAARRGLSNERIMEEIGKCDIVCANCHRERTHRRSSTG